MGKGMNCKLLIDILLIFVKYRLKEIKISYITDEVVANDDYDILG